MRNTAFLKCAVLLWPWLGGCVATVPPAKVAPVKVAPTNRRQVNYVSEGQEIQMGVQVYAEIKKRNKISHDPAVTALVERVGKRIAEAAEKPNYRWEFVAIDDPKTANAFCLPGGKIVVYTGILPLTKDEAGLAVVLGHETAHALADHGADRMNDRVLKAATFAAPLQGKTTEAQLLAPTAFGIGVVPPFSRQQESEADHIGLFLMAKAGYDPQTAVGFWERVAQVMPGKTPPAFLSDHPPDPIRIATIRAEIPEALKYYHP